MRNRSQNKAARKIQARQRGLRARREVAEIRQKQQYKEIGTPLPRAPGERSLMGEVDAAAIAAAELARDKTQDVTVVFTEQGSVGLGLAEHDGRDGPYVHTQFVGCVWCIGLL